MENANKRHVLTYKSGVPNQIKQRSLNLNLQNKTLYGKTQFTTSHNTPWILVYGTAHFVFNNIISISPLVKWVVWQYNIFHTLSLYISCIVVLWNKHFNIVYYYCCSVIFECVIPMFYCIVLFQFVIPMCFSNH